jgi:hypothetical protein
MSKHERLAKAARAVVEHAEVGLEEVVVPLGLLMDLAAALEDGPTFRCWVCGGEMDRDWPSGVCSSECLGRGQGHYRA